MYKSVITTIIGGVSALQYSESLDIGISGTVVLESVSNVDGVDDQNDSGLAISRLNQQIIDLSSVINSRDIEIDRLVNELEVFVCKVCKHRYCHQTLLPYYL